MNLCMSKSTSSLSFDKMESVPLPDIETLDLTLFSVLGHFAKSTRNVQLLSFLLSLDQVDKWTVDYNEAGSDRALDVQIFVQDLQSFVETSVPVLHEVPKEFADMLSHLTTTRCMYLIKYIGQHNEDFLDRFSALLEEESERSLNVAVVLRRLEAFSKAKLLGEIFSGRRLTRILQIMGSYSDV